MAEYTKTYGTMPTREEFDQCWDARMAEEGASDGFHFGNDKRLGTCTLSQDELWEELQKAHREWNGALDHNDDSEHVLGDWISCVLGVLGFEWV